MVQKTHLKKATRELENVQMLSDKDSDSDKKRDHSTDTEDAPRKKARKQASGKKV